MTVDRRGALYLIPNTLDFGTPSASIDLQEVLPLSVIRTAARLGHWIVENAKTTRAFLKRVDAVVPLTQPLQALQITELLRPNKGARHAAAVDLSPMLEPARHGHDIGLMSEAGLPAVADPGAGVVQAAHSEGLAVIAMPGPSSLLLALAASGLNGQSFAFVGYLPTEATARNSRIRELENLSRRASQTQLMIETPYRNEALFGALINCLHADTRLSVACALTLPMGFNRTDLVSGWRTNPLTLPANLPTVFSLLAR